MQGLYSKRQARSSRQGRNDNGLTWQRQSPAPKARKPKRSALSRHFFGFRVFVAWPSLFLCGLRGLGARLAVRFSRKGRQGRKKLKRIYSPQTVPRQALATFMSHGLYSPAPYMMGHHIDKSLPVPNSAEEYTNGVAADGRPLTIVSKELIKPHRPDERQVPPGVGKPAEPKSPHHIEADKQVLQAQQEHIERIRECVEAMRGAVSLAEPARAILAKQAEGALLDQEIANEHKRRYLERLKSAPIEEDVPPMQPTTVGAAFTPPADPDNASGIAFQAMPLQELPAPASAACPSMPKSDSDADTASASPRATRADAAAGRSRSDAREAQGNGISRRQMPRAVRAPSVPHIKFSAATLMMIALRAAKDLPKASAYLCELESKLRPAEAEAKLKEDLYKDKGVAVVTDTLKTLDKSLGDLGFGYWMPFRYPDQWFMFGGILQRVLAAHGLVPSGNAETYRKLLEETPPITPVAADAGPPKSWGQAYRMREFQQMKDVLARIADVRAGRGPPL